MKRLGGLLGKTNSSYRAYPIQLTSIICEEAPPQQLQSDLRVKDDAVLPSFPPSLRQDCLPACLPATDNHRQCSMKEGRKEGRKYGWMNGWMDENWVLSVAHFFYYLPN
jgi:hypothetical protein